jgi:hypothetical protein
MTTFTWTIPTLERNSDDGVVVAHWRCCGEYTVESTPNDIIHTASSYGTVSFTPDPDADGYVAYADLTEATVIGWVQAEVGQSDVEDAIQAQIDELATPSVSVGVPW